MIDKIGESTPEELTVTRKGVSEIAKKLALLYTRDVRHIERNYQLFVTRMM